jgi:hypothetical protein
LDKTVRGFEEQRALANWLWMETRLPGGWVAATSMAQQDGRLVVGELRVFPDAWGTGDRPHGMWEGSVRGALHSEHVPAGGVTATLLRGIRISDSPRFTTNFALQLVGTPDPALDPKAVRARAEEALKSFGLESLLRRRPATSPASTSRRRVGLRELARAAEAYSDAVARKDRKPVHAVARVLGLAGAKGLVTARNRVSQARAAGLLVRGRGDDRNAGRGMVAGTLSPLAKKLLKGRSRG